MTLKYILVTGACGGMGRALSQQLSGAGYGVFALDRRACDPEEKIIPIVADVTDSESIRAAAAEISAVTDELEAIVHFAGVYMLDSLVEMDEDRFDGIIGVNFKGAFLINRQFTPMLRRGGRIIMTTSELATLDPLPFTGIYAVSKCALDRYAYSLAMELQLLEIYVSVIRAGAVQTDMIGNSTDELSRFCEDTGLYKCNADRFRSIVDSVESRCTSAETIAQTVIRILKKRRPKFAYSINRNPLLSFFGCLPNRCQLMLIRRVLK